MAKYNREFLIPYLQDVCTLHMAYRKLSARKKQLERNIYELQQDNGYYRPSPPSYEPLFSVGMGFGLFFGVLFSFTGVFGFFMPGLSFGFVILYLLTIGLGVAIIKGIIDEIQERKKRNEEKKKEYHRMAEADLQTHRRNQQKRARVPALRTEVQHCIAEQQRVRNVLNNVYSVNIIPNHYRNAYAAMYLYDYFNNSRETDLATALNTYVLEQIKDRLDHLIAQMSDVILNQYMIMDNQRSAMEQAERHHAEMCGKLNRLQITAEEQSVYLDMIEANTATLKYFAAADYIRKL